MRKLAWLLALALAGLGAQRGWRRYQDRPPRYEAIYETPYVAVYGRDSCAVTQSMLRELGFASVPFVYRDINRPDALDELARRMKDQRIDVDAVPLPVVDVNGRLSIRPELSSVLESYRGR